MLDYPVLLIQSLFNYAIQYSFSRKYYSPINGIIQCLSLTPCISVKWLAASGCAQHKMPHSDFFKRQRSFRVWHFSRGLRGGNTICCHAAHYNVWEGGDEEREEAKRRKQQMASSVVKLDEQTLRDVVFNLLVVSDIRLYIQTQLNIKHPGV